MSCQPLLAALLAAHTDAAPKSAGAWRLGRPSSRGGDRTPRPSAPALMPLTPGLIPARPEWVRSTATFPTTPARMSRPLEAMAVALVRQEQAAEADECGEGDGDLTSGVDVSFPDLRAPHRLSAGLRGACVEIERLGTVPTIGEKQEQTRRKSAVGDFSSLSARDRSRAQGQARSKSRTSPFSAGSNREIAKPPPRR